MAPTAVLATAPVRPDGVVLGNDDAVNPQGLGRPQQGAEVPRILDLVEGQEERRLTARPGHLQQGIEVDVLGGGDARHHSLMLG